MLTMFRLHQRYVVLQEPCQLVVEHVKFAALRLLGGTMQCASPVLYLRVHTLVWHLMVRMCLPSPIAGLNAHMDTL